MADTPTAPGSYAKVGSTVQDDQGRRGIVVGAVFGLGGDTIQVWWPHEHDTYDVWRGRVTLPLDVDTNRAHVAWGVAERLGDAGPVDGLRFFGDPVLGWRDTWWIKDGDDLLWCFTGRPVRTPCQLQNVPALAHIDLSDLTTLPDGSRLADVLALAAVAAHVEATDG